jgi:ABC-type multidrug transport system ATPase subunit
VILHDVGFGLEAGDRIGLLGPNGAGKSTLVKTLVGELPLLAGERVAHPDMKIGYFAQHTVESLHEGQSPLWHLKELAPNAGEQVLRNYLGRWNFVGDRAFENVDGFSGGERARLALALIAFLEPNVLLLDEPTNHLDLDMREALAEALSDFPGAIVLVSHDRHLIGLVCETFWRVADGALRRLYDARRFLCFLGDGEGRLLVRHRHVAAAKAAVFQSAQKLRDLIGPHRFLGVAAVDAVFLQPIAVDQRRARMLDRPADDASAYHCVIIPRARNSLRTGSSGMPRMVK